MEGHPAIETPDMEHQDTPALESTPLPEEPAAKRPYVAPKVESVQLSREAAESLT